MGKNMEKELTDQKVEVIGGQEMSVMYDNMEPHTVQLCHDVF